MKPKNIDAYTEKLEELALAEPDENTSRVINDHIKVTDLFLKVYKLKMELSKQIQTRPSDKTIEFVNP